MKNQETFNRCHHLSFHSFLHSRKTQNWVIYAPVLPSIDAVPVSMAPSLEQNHNALLLVNASVVPYSAHQLSGLETWIKYVDFLKRSL